MLQTSRKRLITSMLSIVLVWGFVAFIFVERQAVYDWWQLRNYTAPSEIADLATQTTMNDSARRLFYVYHPRVEPRDSFNKHCRDGEFTIVLGCYSSGRGIFIFRVDDPRLDGIEQVTAAHELLHAAYERLSGPEKDRIDRLTTEAYQNMSNDRIKETIAEYEKDDPSVVPNELHSILGTELGDLPAGLEAYYKQYFNDRSQIVAFSRAYESEFTTRKNEAKTAEEKLTNLKSQIDSENEALSLEQKQLKQDASTIESMRQPDADTDKVNALINHYNQAVVAYNSRVRAVSALVDNYNALYESYKQIVLEQQDLFKAIDSRPQQI
jgi:hypothetical protein